jgi:hypothetical protein
MRVSSGHLVIATRVRLVDIVAAALAAIALGLPSPAAAIQDYSHAAGSNCSGNPQDALGAIFDDFSSFGTTHSAGNMAISLTGWNQGGSGGSLLLNVDGTHCVGEDPPATSAISSSHKYVMKMWHGGGQTVGTPVRVHSANTQACSGKWIVDSSGANGYVEGRQALKAAFPKDYVEQDAYWGNTQGMTQCEGPNVASDGTVAVIHDIGAPTITGGPQGPTNSKSPTFSYSGAPAGAAYECRIDSAPFATCPNTGYAVPQSPGLSEGSHAFQVRIKDSGGRTDQPVAERDFSVDVTPPTLSASGPMIDTPSQPTGVSPEVQFDATDARNDVVSATLSINSSEVEYLTQADESCDASPCAIHDIFSPDLSAMTPGTYPYKVDVADAAGNHSALTGQVHLDPSSPTIQLSGPLFDANGGQLSTPSGTLNISAADSTSGNTGVAELDVAVDGTNDMSQSSNCTAACPGSANASYTYDASKWGDGTHTVTVSAYDQAGNEATQDLSFYVGAPGLPGCPDVQSSVQQTGTAASPIVGGQAASGFMSSSVGPSTPAPDDSSSATSTDASTGSATILDPSLEPDSSLEAPGATSVDSLSQDALDTSASGGFSLEDTACFVPMQTTAAAADATLEDNAAALYTNTATSTDTIIRPVATGEAIIQDRRQPDAPLSFSWKVGLEPGLQLQQLSSGAIAIVDPAADPPSGGAIPPDPYASMTANQVPAKLSDVQTQLDEEAYQVAAAEAETHEAVVAVIEPPYGVTATGTKTAASLQKTGPDTMTVTAGPDAQGVVTVVAKKPHSWCKTWFDLLLNRDREIGTYNRLCIKRDGAKHDYRGHFDAHYPNNPGGQMAARLQVRLYFVNANTGRSREAVDPYTPLRLNTPWHHGEPQSLYCARLWEHTANLRGETFWRIPKHGRLCWGE